LVVPSTKANADPMEAARIFSIGMGPVRKVSAAAAQECAEPIPRNCARTVLRWSQLRTVGTRRSMKPSVARPASCSLGIGVRRRVARDRRAPARTARTPSTRHASDGMAAARLRGVRSMIRVVAGPSVVC
jgi:hypothetical protein